MIITDSFFALNPRIQRPFVGPSKGSSWYQSKDFENDEIFPWPRILHKKHPSMKISVRFELPIKGKFSVNRALDGLSGDTLAAKAPLKDRAVDLIDFVM